MTEPRLVPPPDPSDMRWPAPLARAVLTLDAGQRVTRVEVAGDWDLAADVSHWSGRSLRDLFDTTGFRAVERILRDRHGPPVDVICPTSGADIPLRVAVDLSGDDVRLHVADRRGMAEVQAQLSRALTALETDRREDRRLDGRHRALLAGITEAIVLVDIGSGRMVEMSAAAGPILGGNSAGLAGAAFTQCFEGRRRSEFIDTLAAGALSGEGLPIAAELRHSRGRVDLWPSMSRAGDETLLVCRMRHSSGDVADTLPHGMERLMATTRDGIACLDAEGSILHANPAFVAMVGAAATSQVLGRRLADYLPRGDIDLRAMTERNRPATYGTRLFGVEGRRLSVEIAATNLPDGGLGLIVRDTSLSDVTRDIAPTPRADAAADTASLVGTVPLRDIVAATTDAVERSCIDAALALTGDNRAAAAEMLGLSRQSLYVKLRKFGLLQRDEV